VETPIAERLRALDIDSLTPLEALNALAQLRSMATRSTDG
jgi:hypothetical protein